MKRIYIFTIMALFALISPSVGHASDAVKAGTYILDKNHGKITWSISHFGFSTYIGQFTDVGAILVLDSKHLGKSTLDVTVATASVGTLNPSLDEHLKSADFFNVAKFPTATFHATHIVRIGAKKAEIHGDLTLLGVSKPITIEATLNKAAANPMFKVYEAGFTGHTTIQRSEFGMTKYVPFVGDDVSLEIEGEFKLVK